MKYSLTPPSQWVLTHSGLAPTGSQVLDIACGPGRHTRLFLERGYQVTTVDIDTSGLADIDDPNLTIIEADLEGGPWPLKGQTFGTIIVTNYLHRPLFPHIIEALEPGGILIYETFAKGHEKYGKPDNPDFLLEPGELEITLQDFGEIIAFEEVQQSKPRPAVRQRICARKNA